MKRIVVVFAAISLACNGTFRFDEHSIFRDAGDASSSGSAPFADGGAPTSCASDSSCPPGASRCDVVSGRCVSCLADADCAAPTWRCSASVHACVACLVREDCGARQQCHVPTGRCLDTCAEGAEHCPDGLSCDEREELCVACRTNTHCAGSPGEPRCEPDTRRCVECVGSADCPGERPLCDRRRGACVGCVSSAQCPQSAACDSARGQCVDLP
jgi:hypothetical protein